MEQKVYNLLGLCRKAGLLVSGEDSTEMAIKNFSASLVIVATDASCGTKKKFKDSCDFYEVQYAEFGTKDSLGQAIGKEYRSNLAVTDEALATKIIGIIQEISGR